MWAKPRSSKERVWLAAATNDAVVWKDVLGYRDADADYVLLLHGRMPKPTLRMTVPTPTERDRTAVLKLLDERGVRRQD